MKVLNRIKSIYLLAIVALLSFCMLLFPAMPKTAGADGAMGSGEVEIKTARVIVQKYAHNTEKWAIMFKAQVSLEQYNLITDNDTADVKFGMLIGPSARLESLADDEYGTLTGAGYRAISYVGSVAGEKIQEIEFAEGATTYDYWGSIVFDDGSLSNVEGKGDIRKGAASTELTAIPYYYSVGGDEVVLMEGAKSAVPRNILVESYLLQTDDVVDEDSEPINKDTTVKNYAGEVEVFDGDAYICRSTNRLMVGAKQGELAPADIVADNTTANVVVNAKAVQATGVEGQDDLLNADFVAGLDKYGKANLIVYGEEITAYKTQVAERVITRFADTEATKLTAVEGVATRPEDYNATADYFAKASVTINANGNISARQYTSIFSFTKGGKKFVAYNDGATSTRVSGATYGVGVFMTTMDTGFDGLYVLGKNITLPTAHTYSVMNGNPYSYNINVAATGADTDTARYSYAVPTLGLGFGGTLDGRGFIVDVASKADEGVLPNTFGATIKNIAFVGLRMTYEGGGIAFLSRATTFENVYARVSSVTNNNADLNKGVLMNVQNCTFNNFVAEVNTITDSVMTTALTYGAGTSSNTKAGTGQGVSTSGVFSFRTFLDSYYDASIDRIRMTDNPGLSGQHVIDNIDIEVAKKYFPNFVHQNGTLVKSWVNSSRTTNYNPNVAGFIYASYMYDPEQGWITSGTRGTNVYAVGSTPLYVGYQYDSESASGAVLKATTKATVFVNPDENMEYYTGEDTTASVDMRMYLSGAKFYKMSDLVDPNGLFTFDAEDGKYSLGEIILRGKVFRHGETRMTNLLGESNPDDVLEVRMFTMEGWHDVASYEAMAPYVLAQETPFDAEFWNVSEEGIVTWKKLA